MYICLFVCSTESNRSPGWIWCQSFPVDCEKPVKGHQETTAWGHQCCFQPPSTMEITSQETVYFCISKRHPFLFCYILFCSVLFCSCLPCSVLFHSETMAELRTEMVLAKAITPVMTLAQEHIHLLALQCFVGSFLDPPDSVLHFVNFWYSYLQILLHVRSLKAKEEVNLEN